MATNYSFTYVPGAVTIKKAYVTITASSPTVAYGDPVPTITASFSAFKNSETSSSALSTQPTCTTTYTVTSNAGTSPTTSCTGAVATNYSFTYVPGSANITAAPLTITAVTNSKTYDGTTSAAAVPTVAGLRGTDTATGLAEVYDNKNFGLNNHTMTVSAYTVNDGNSGNNYTVSTVTNTTGSISKAPLTITAVTNSKTYDGTNTAAAISTVSGIQTGDSVTGLSETYDNRNAGTGKMLSVATYTVNDGNSGNNYSVTTVTNTTGVINKATLTLTAIANTKVFDNNTSAANVPTIMNLKPGDSVTNLAEVYDTPFAGTGKTMSVSMYTVNDGNAGGNYNVVKVTNTNGVITAYATTTAVTVTLGTAQYSDQVTFTATLAPATVGGAIPATGVKFKVGTQYLNATAIPLSVSGGVLTASLTTALLEPSPFGTPPTGQMAQGARTVTAEFTGVDTLNFGVSNPTTTLNITREDARVSFSGLEFYSTPSVSSSAAAVTLQATVRDLTAVTMATDPLDPQASTDSYAGDIRNARVSFGSLNTTLPASCQNLTPTLVNSNDPKTGIVTCTATLDIGSQDAAEFTITMTVSGNYYYRVSPLDYDVVTVAKPLTGFVTGGGYLVNQASAGTYAGTTGAKTNFGLNVKNNKSGNNLQGNLNVIIRQLTGGVWRTYQIKSNATDSLVETTPTPSTGTASWTGKANLTDISDPLNPISLGGALTFQITLTDNGEPGNNDKIGFQLMNGSTLLYSSDWNGVKTIEQVLGGGNLQVR